MAVKDRTCGRQGEAMDPAAGLDGGAAIDEERRLCYVGITRAKDKLTLSLSLSRMKWGKPRPTIPSRFLFEMTGRADNPHQRGKTAVRTPSRAPRR